MQDEINAQNSILSDDAKQAKMDEYQESLRTYKESSKMLMMILRKRTGCSK